MKKEEVIETQHGEERGSDRDSVCSTNVWKVIPHKAVHREGRDRDLVCSANLCKLIPHKAVHADMYTGEPFF